MPTILGSDPDKWGLSMKGVRMGVKHHFRTIWLSDVHLGYKGCKAEYLLDFLQATHAETIYLVGDIIDFWSMNKTMYWPQAHNEVIRLLLDKVKQGSRLIYVPGNHDEVIREFDGVAFGRMRVCEEYIHHTADGKRLLLLHGDKFDGVIKCSRLAERLGNFGYDLLLYLNRQVNHFRRLAGFPYWSLAGYIKSRVKNAMRHVHNFEQAVTHDARKQGVDGVVCGHIHHPAINTINGILYFNTGDWVENCTALAEHADGTMELIHWSEVRQTMKLLPALEAVVTKAA